MGGLRLEQCRILLAVVQKYMQTMLTLEWFWIHLEMDGTRPDCREVCWFVRRERRGCPSDSATKYNRLIVYTMSVLVDTLLHEMANSDFNKTKSELVLRQNFGLRPNMQILPRDAMRKRGLCCRLVSVRLSVCHVRVLYLDCWRYRQTFVSAR